MSAADATDGLRTIAAEPPDLAESELRSVLRDHYGLAGELRPLVSERDQNFAVTTPEGQRFVLKIANGAEDPVVTDFQIRALQHLEAQGCPVPTPRVVPTVNDTVSVQLDHARKTYVARLVTYLDGNPITGRSISEPTAYAVGAALAHLDHALADFSHPGDSQPLLWDMQRAPELRLLLHHIDDVALRDTIGACLDDFEAQLLPYLRGAERQVIHGDLNPGNVLLEPDGSSVAGIIDFGDMVRAPVAVDLAIAASYFRKRGKEDPLALIAALVAGYASVSAIADEALALLHGMIRTRLATSITLLHWRLQARPAGDVYSEASVASEDDSPGFLAAIDAIGAARFLKRLRQAVGR